MTGYPWTTGDALLADDLNAAIANSAAYGPFLPITGGTVTGRTNFFSTDWLRAFVGWVADSSHVYALHPTGSIGITGAAQTIDGESVGPHVASIGVVGYGMNNRPGSDGSSAWAGYFEARGYPGVYTYTTGIEIDVMNLFGSDAPFPTPYGMSNPVSIGLNMACGGEPSAYGLTAHNASTAIAVLDNGARWQTGILFRSTSLAGTDGAGSGQGAAISLATNHALVWTKPDNTPGPIIVSNQTTGSAPTLSFENSGLRLSTGGMVLDGGGSLGLGGSGNIYWFVGGASSYPSIMSTQTTGSAVQLVFDNNQGYLRDGTLSLPLLGVVTGVPTAGNTSLLLRVNNNAGSSMVPVILGAPDSAGSGYRTLRVAN